MNHFTWPLQGSNTSSWLLNKQKKNPTHFDHVATGHTGNKCLLYISFTFWSLIFENHLLVSPPGSILKASISFLPDDHCVRVFIPITCSFMQTCELWLLSSTRLKGWAQNMRNIFTGWLQGVQSCLLPSNLLHVSKHLNIWVNWIKFNELLSGSPWKLITVKRYRSKDSITILEKHIHYIKMESVSNFRAISTYLYNSDHLQEGC